MKFTGWIDAPGEVEKHLALMPMPLYADHGPKIQDNKQVLLYKIFEETTNQKLDLTAQGIGDCVGWGYSSCLDVLQGVQKLKDPTLEFQQIAVEATYAFSRVEIGGQRGSRSDGSTGIWASRAVTTKGSLSRPYLQAKLGSGKYDPNRSKLWGANGVPDELEPEAALRIAKTASQVLTFEQAAGAIQNGYPIPICSTIGFHMKRDTQGFVQHNPRDPWAHCMVAVGVRFDRPGLAIKNSWGPRSWQGNPSPLGEPLDTVWVDAHIVNLMLAARDSYAISQYTGFPAQDLANWEF